MSESTTLPTATSIEAKRKWYEPGVEFVLRFAAPLTRQELQAALMSIYVAFVDFEPIGGISFHPRGNWLFVEVNDHQESSLLLVLQKLQQLFQPEIPHTALCEVERISSTYCRVRITILDWCEPRNLIEVERLRCAIQDHSDATRAEREHNTLEVTFEGNIDIKATRDAIVEAFRAQGVTVVIAFKRQNV